jgi:hypothetical protein
MEQIRERLTTELNKLSQLNIRDDVDVGMRILQILGANLLGPIQLARKTNLAIIAQG